MRLQPPSPPRATFHLEPAGTGDAAAIAAVRLAAARELTSRHGTGTWSFAVDSEAGVRLELGGGGVFLAREGTRAIATLRLATRQPWLGTFPFFTACARPVFLTAMAVQPERQRQGVGRRCLEEARRIAAEWHGDMIRLDSYDAPAGAGDFYRRCGYREVARVDYHGTPLLLFETAV
jgi:GNAT superfamily N-acetyltransferase